jgi:hypothetical protein
MADDRLSVEWVAGWLEGEGSGYPVLSATTTDEDVARAVAEFLGAKVYGMEMKPPRKYRWSIWLSGPKAAEKMFEVLPYMFSRRAQQILKVLQNYKPGRRNVTLSPSPKNVRRRQRYAERRVA